MTTWKQLSRPLRALIAAPWLLLAAAVVVGFTPGFQQLILDPANKPTTPVSLTSPNWTGTLDAGRLPDSVVQYRGNSIVAPINYQFGQNTASIGTSGAGLDLNLEASSDGGGNWTFPGTVATGLFRADGGLVTTDGGGDLSVNSSVTVPDIYVSDFLAVQPGAFLLLYSPDGTAFYPQVDDSGNLSAQAY